MRTSIESVDVIVLCGGLGTRLQRAFDGPKALAPVGDRPFLDLLLDFAAGQGARRFILCVGHKADAIEKRIKNDARGTILFSREESPMGTAGALKLCEGLRESALSIVMNGDSFCAVDLAVLLELHREREAVATMTVAPAEGRDDAGNVAMDADGRIAAFAEKSSAAGSRFVNAGIYAVSDRFFAEIPVGEPASLEKNIFPNLTKRSALYGFLAPGPLYDIGTPERLEAFRARWKK